MGVNYCSGEATEHLNLPHTSKSSVGFMQNCRENLGVEAGYTLDWDSAKLTACGMTVEDYCEQKLNLVSMHTEMN